MSDSKWLGVLMPKTPSAPWLKQIEKRFTEALSKKPVSEDSLTESPGVDDINGQPDCQDLASWAVSFSFFSCNKKDELYDMRAQ